MEEFGQPESVKVSIDAAVVQEVARVPGQARDGGSRPTSSLHPGTYSPKEIEVRVVHPKVARIVCESKHYLGSFPGGAVLSFGIFVEDLLLGVAVLGVGSANLHRLFREAKAREVIALARLWLDDRLGRNSESRTLAIILRHLRRDQTTIKAVVAYSDPRAGHNGIIYRGAGMIYIGERNCSPCHCPQSQALDNEWRYVGGLVETSKAREPACCSRVQ